MRFKLLRSHQKSLFKRTADEDAIWLAKVLVSSTELARAAVPDQMAASFWFVMEHVLTLGLA